MRVRLPFLNRFHLDSSHGLLSSRNVQIVREFFAAIDSRGIQALDDVQFLCFMKATTDLSENQIYALFDMFDVDDSGTVEFDEFYLLFCILVAVKDHTEREFLYRHSRTCFELLDEDGSKSISVDEFSTLGFLLGYGRRAVRQMFKEFDVTGDRELDYQEFRMFTVACIDKQSELEAKRRRALRQKQEERQRRVNDADDDSAGRVCSIQ